MSDKSSESIICDGCGEEMIEHTSYPACYKLRLTSPNYNRNDTGFQYAVACYPPIEGAKDFCNRECLKKWLAD